MQPSRDLRVLVVDDDHAVRRTVARSLRSGGYSVEVAGSAEDALTALAAGAQSPHLVVSDIVMPGMSGVALAKRLKLLDQDIPILLITGFAGDHLRPERAEAFDVLEKPFTPDQLLERVAAAIARGAGWP